MGNGKQKGFTLMEMIAVISIIGILASVIVPYVTGYKNKAKLTKAQQTGRQISLAVYNNYLDEDTYDPNGIRLCINDMLNGCIENLNVPSTMDTGNKVNIKYKSSGVNYVVTVWPLSGNYEIKQN